jgi:TRAP transporter TAXI family solute receptor
MPNVTDGLRAAFALLCALFLLAACDQAPSPQDVKADLSHRLEAGYTAGLFEIANVSTVEPPASTRLDLMHRIVPFTIDLKLKRDHDFGAWDQANANALIHLLGARPDAADGIKTAGNKAGDTIRMTGIATYVRDNGKWRYEPSPVRKPIAAEETPSRTQVLKQLAQLALATMRVMVVPSRAPEVLDELAGSTARLERLDSGFAVASGPVGSDYWLLAEAARIQKRGSVTPVVNVATRGALENLRLLHDGKITAAIVQNNEAAMAEAGTGPFERIGTFPDLRAVASLFPKPIHIVVMAASPIASVSELPGKRLVVAATGPAALTEATDILKAHRVGLAALAAPPEQIPLARALIALERGEFDAAIITAAAPAEELQDFAAGHSLRFVPLDGDAIALMTAGAATYLPITLPSQIYPGQARPVATVAVAAQLVSLATVSPSEVETLLKVMLGEVDYLHHGSGLGAMVSLHSAKSGLTLPLHQGAEAYLSAVAQKGG